MSRRSYIKRHSSSGSASTACCIGDSEGIAPHPAHLDAAALLFDAFSDPTRLRILWALSLGELCVCDLAAATGVTQSAVSHQLRLLRDRRLVVSEREGRHVIYRLADAHVETLLLQGVAHAGEHR